MKQNCQCPCGDSKFTLQEKPILRFICHCKICQSVYRKPYADVTVLFAGNVDVHSGHSIDFQKHRLPPALQRGSCHSCENPVVGYLRLAPFVKLAFVPTINYPAEVGLSEPSMHIFYNSRISEADDELPKHSGYLKSQLALSYQLISALLQK